MRKQYHEHSEHEHGACHCHEHSHEEGMHRHIHDHAENCACRACARAANIFDELEEEIEEQNREFKKEITFLAVTGALFAVLTVFCHVMPEYEKALPVQCAFFTLFVLCGWTVVKTALSLLAKGDIFNEYTLMASAACAAIFIGEIHEAVAVMLFYRLGEALQDRAASKSRRSVKSLLAQKPMEARLVTVDGERLAEPSEIQKGDIVRVLPGEVIPVDGRVTGGTSRIDCSAITGESLPVYVQKGSDVSGGTLSTDGVLTIEASGPFEDSTISRMLEMVQNAVEKKAPAERFITRFAKWYTPAMFFTAAAVFGLLLLLGRSVADALSPALVMLVISCPCALVISIPLGYFGGIGCASARGILVKGAHVFDNLRKVSVAVFDKTGTLTYGKFKVSQIMPVDGVSEKELLRTAITAEKGSVHPLALSICREMPEITLSGDAEIKEVPGRGMICKDNGQLIVAGNSQLMSDYGVHLPLMPNDGTVVHVLKNDKYLGCIAVADEIREDSYPAIRELESMGLHTYMLTGDREEVARAVCDRLKMSGYRARLQPEDKVDALNSICDGDMSRSVFVGDGVNDGPVLITSDTGIAMGGFGSRVAAEVSDVVIVDDSPLKVSVLLKIAKKTRIIVWENVILTSGIKALFMMRALLSIVGVCGEPALWEAVFADVGVALLAILNATRAARN